jgi:hypothetical protein
MGRSTEEAKLFTQRVPPDSVALCPPRAGGMEASLPNHHQPASPATAQEPRTVLELGASFGPRHFLPRGQE